MGTIGPKTNPRPLILHVDSDTNIPYRLAEADSLYIGSVQAGTLSATTFSALTLSGLGDVSSPLTPANGEGLIWDSTAGKWKSGPVGGGGGGGTPGGPYNSVQYNKAGSFSGESAFSYNDATDTLSVANLNLTNALPVAQGGTGSTNAAAALTSLGAQASDPTLSAIASLTPGADQYIYFSATDGAALATITSFARGILDDVDATATRSTLGLGSLATQNPSLAGSYQVLYANTGSVSSVTTPTDGTFLKYTTANKLHWDVVTGTVSIPVTVAQGGTGSTTLTDGYVLIGSGTNPVNSIASATFATSSLSNFTGPLTVAKGGTGQTTLTANQVLIGNGTGGINSIVSTTFADASLTNFTGPLSIAKGGTNNTSFPSNSILYYNAAATGVTGVGTFTFDGTNLSVPTLNPTNALTVSKGGTGQTTLTANQVLIGNGTAGINSIASTTFADASLTNFTGPLTVAKGGTNSTSFTNNRVPYYVTATAKFTDSANLTFDGTTLTANQLSLTTALSVANGGTGNTTFTTGNLLVGSGTNAVNSIASATFATSSLSNFTGPLTVAKGGTGQTTLPTNQLLLGSGTNAVASVASPTDNTYLKYTTAGGYSWGTPAGGGWTTVIKSSDTARTTTTPSNDPDLIFTASANSKYAYRLKVMFETAGGSNFNYGIACVTASPRLTWFLGIQGPVDGGQGTLTTEAGSGNKEVTGGVFNDGTGYLTFEGTVDNSSNGSTAAFSFKWSSGGSGKTATVYTGSYLEYYKI